MASKDIATFGAGCFWHVEEEFRKVKGVTSTIVGYTGGHTKDPTYKEVCSGKTGHIEAVRLEYDPKVITYKELLRKFFEIHDPTSVDRQGLDFGEQYRSVIFYHDENQKKQAEEEIKKSDKSGKYRRKIATKVIKAQEFFKAEEYHQKYLMKKGLDACPI